MNTLKLKSSHLFKNTVAMTFAFLLTACGSGNDVNINVNGVNFDRADRWEQDVNFLATTMEATHPNMYHTVTEAEFDLARDALIADIPNLTDEAIFVELLKLLALVGQERDGHMGAGWFAGTGYLLAPLKFYLFEDGVYVIQATEPYRHLIGQRLVDVGGMPLSQVHELFSQVLARDNDNNEAISRHLAYVTPVVLQELGITDSLESISYGFEAPETQEYSVQVVAAQSPSNFPANIDTSYNLPFDGQLTFLRGDEPLWLQYHEEQDVLQIKLNQMRDGTGSISISELAQQAQDILLNSPVERVILDVRHNNGGTNELVGPIIDFLSNPDINQQGKLIVFTDRQTFSAAGNLVAEIDYRTNATLAGTAPGGSGSQYGDNTEVRLPNSNLLFFIPTRFHQFGDPNNQPKMQEMDHVLDITSVDYFAGRDALLEYYLNL